MVLDLAVTVGLTLRLPLLLLVPDGADVVGVVRGMAVASGPVHRLMVIVELVG